MPDYDHLLRSPLPPCVWLTSDPDMPDDSCTRHGVRISVIPSTDRRLVHWPKYIRKLDAGSETATAAAVAAVDIPPPLGARHRSSVSTSARSRPTASGRSSASPLAGAGRRCANDRAFRHLRRHALAHVAEVDMHAGRELAPSEPTLAERAASINSHIEQAIAACDSHRILAGLELIEARKHVPHGQWELWCAENIDRSYRDVRRLYGNRWIGRPGRGARARASGPEGD